MRALGVVAALYLAYVMPGYSIVRRMADKRDDLALTTVKADGSAQVGPALLAEVSKALGVQAQGDLSLTMSVSMRVPGRCRIEIASTESTRAIAAVNSNGKRRSDGAEVAALQVLTDEVCALLAVRGSGEGDVRATVERHLQGLKIDYKKSSLGRFGGQVAYVLGDDKNASSSQLWVYKAEGDEKKGLQPARVKLTDDKGQAWDVRFLDYNSQPTGDAFPRVLEIYRGDALQLRLTTLEVDLRAKLDDNKL